MDEPLIRRLNRLHAALETLCQEAATLQAEMQRSRQRERWANSASDEAKRPLGRTPENRAV